MKTPTKATLRSAVAWGVLLLVLDWALSCRAQALNSSLSQVPGQRNTALSLYTADGYFYPQLESLLSDPSAIVISSVAELTALSAYNATTATISTSQRRTIVVSATFFSIFRTSTVPLYQQGPNGSQVVPVSFQVEKGSELFLVGFRLSWGAIPAVAPPSAPSNGLTELQQLLASLQLYVRVRDDGSKLQLLRTTVVGITCASLVRLYEGLSLMRQRYAVSPLTQGVRPEMRLVFPHLFVSYAQIGPIWVEDMCIMCRDPPDPAACPPLPPLEYNITSHDDLLSAVQTLGSTDFGECQDRTAVLQLRNNLVIDAQRWPDNGVFLTSNVTFRCPPGAMTVFDFGGLLDMFKVRGAAYVQFHNLVLANLPLHPVGPFEVPMWQFHYPRDMVVTPPGRVHLVNTTGVIPQDEYVFLNYWSQIIMNPTPGVNALAGWQSLIQYMNLTSYTDDEMRFSRLVGIGISCENIALTTRTFGVQLLHPLTGLGQLFGTDFRTGPPFVIGIYTPGQLARILSMPDDSYPPLAQLNGLTITPSTAIMLVLQNNITLSRSFWPPPQFTQVRRKVTIQGAPFKDLWLDFGGGTGYMSVVGTGQVRFRDLQLRNAGWQLDYNATTATRYNDVHQFLQMGMWTIEYDRLIQNRVALEQATVLVSPQEFNITVACLGSQRNGTALPGGLTQDMCSHIMPSDAVIESVDATVGELRIASARVDAYDALELTIAVDPYLQRPDLVMFMEGAYRTTPQAPEASPESPNTAAIIGGVVGGAVGLALLSALLLVVLVRRNRKRAQQEAARGLQAKQQSHLEELSKTNPLAQLILDHLAGKDPGVAQLVLGTDRTSSSVERTAGSVAGGPGDCRADNSSLTAGAGVGALGGGPQLLKVPSGSAGLVSSGSEEPRSRDVAGMRGTPLNAADLAALFKHLTILGPTYGGEQPDSHASSSKTAKGNALRPSGGSSPAGGSMSGQPVQPLSGFAGFTQAMVQRLQRKGLGKSKAKGDKGERSSAAEGVAGADSGSGSGADGDMEKGPNPASAKKAGSGSGQRGGSDGAEGTPGEGSAGGEEAAAGAGGQGGGRSGHAVAAAASVSQLTLPENLQSPVLEELLRLSVDLAGEIDDNQLIVTDVVASGGFGTVYKGMWHNLPVAVKIVLFSTASVNRRIALQEAALSKSISHVNIIATYAVDAKPMTVLNRAPSAPSTGGSGGGANKRSLAEIQEWRLYIIQEFADGGTLRRTLDRGAFHDPYSGQPRMEMILDIAQGVAAALAHLHAKNVVHGDLNPKNVLLKHVAQPAPGMGLGPSWGGRAGSGGRPAGSGAAMQANKLHQAALMASLMPPANSAQYGAYPYAGRCGYAIKVADFGLSVKMENSHISGLRQGTPFYAAPELTTLGIFSRAADCYAYGVLLWELYWGRPIWVPDARAPGGYVQHPDFPALPPACPHDYAQLLADCLQLNHTQRPAFDEVTQRLKAMACSLATAAICLDSGSLSMPGPAVALPASYPTPSGPRLSGSGMGAGGGGGGGGTAQSPFQHRLSASGMPQQHHHHHQQQQHQQRTSHASTPQQGYTWGNGTAYQPAAAVPSMPPKAPSGNGRAAGQGQGQGDAVRRTGSGSGRHGTQQHGVQQHGETGQGQPDGGAWGVGGAGGALGAQAALAAVHVHAAGALGLAPAANTQAAAVAAAAACQDSGGSLCDGGGLSLGSFGDSRDVDGLEAQIVVLPVPPRQTGGSWGRVGGRQMPLAASGNAAAVVLAEAVAAPHGEPALLLRDEGSWGRHGTPAEGLIAVELCSSTLFSTGLSLDETDADFQRYGRAAAAARAAMAVAETAAKPDGEGPGGGGGGGCGPVLGGCAAGPGLGGGPGAWGYGGAGDRGAAAEGVPAVAVGGSAGDGGQPGGGVAVAGAMDGAGGAVWAGAQQAAVSGTQQAAAQAQRAGSAHVSGMVGLQAIAEEPEEQEHW